MDVFLWINRRDRALSVRVMNLREGQADYLKETYGGHVGGWSEKSQWEVEGRQCLAFMADHPEWRLRVEARE